VFTTLPSEIDQLVEGIQKFCQIEARANSPNSDRFCMWLLLTTVLACCPHRIRRGGNSEIVSRNPADFSDNSTTLVARVIHPRRFYLSPACAGCGVVQADSLKMDISHAGKAATNSYSAAIARCREVNFIRQNRGVNPGRYSSPCSRDCQISGHSCWMSSNFGWDFIYRAWGGEFIEFAD